MGPFRVCASLMSETVEGFEVLAREALDEGADLIELRLDALTTPDLAASAVRGAKDLGATVIATVRSREEGGRYSAGPKKLVEVLKAVSGHADLVDLDRASLELREVRSLASELGEDRVLASAHLGPGDPGVQELVQVAEALSSYGYLVKLVTSPVTAAGAASTLGLFREVGWSRGRLVAFSVGERWSLTRPLSLVLGAPFTYAALKGREVAPGQLSVRETKLLAEIFSRVMALAPARADR
ncbi:MAG: type I 3-dehydroquinate dehydratase [Candidatus Caldarchaeales archaeon]